MGYFTYSKANVINVSKWLPFGLTSIRIGIGTIVVTLFSSTHFISLHAKWKRKKWCKLLRLAESYSFPVMIMIHQDVFALSFFDFIPKKWLKRKSKKFGKQSFLQHNKMKMRNSIFVGLLFHSTNLFSISYFQLIFRAYFNGIWFIVNHGFFKFDLQSSGSFMVCGCLLALYCGVAVNRNHRLSIANTIFAPNPLCGLAIG